MRFGGFDRGARTHRRAWLAVATLMLSSVFVLVETQPVSALPPFQLYLPTPWSSVVNGGGPHPFNGISGTRNSVDLGRSGGAEMSVHAAASGTLHIQTANCWVSITHTDGWETMYYHLKNIDTSLDGQPVQAGQRIADAGQPGVETCGSGTSNFKHVHFAIRQNGQDVNIDGLSIGGYTIHATAGNYCGYWTRNSDGSIVADSRASCGAMPSVTNNILQPTPDTLTASAISVAMPEGAWTFRPVQYSFTVNNPTNAAITARAVFMAFRDPYGSNYDHPCDNGINVSIAAGSSWVCHTAGPSGYGSTGTYRIWPGWESAPGTWPSLGPEQTFTLNGPFAQLRLSSPFDVSFPQGAFIDRPIQLSFTVTNQSNTSITANPLIIAARDPYGANVDLNCGTVTIASHAPHTCTVRREAGYASEGTYTYWIDWLSGDGWHGAGQFGGTRTFSLAASRYAPLGPARLLETRSGQSTFDGQFNAIGQRAAGSTTELLVGGRAGVPTNAAAAILNVTAVNPAGKGYVTVWPCGTERPSSSSLNLAAGRTIANAVIAKIGSGGKVCIYTTAATHLLIDLNGIYPAGAAFTPSSPARLMETRSGQSTIDGLFNNIGARAPGSTTELQVTGRATTPNNAVAVALNVTAVSATAGGYLTVWPCGSTRPTSSTLNFAAGQTIANLTIAKVGTNGRVCIYTTATTHLLIDLNGIYPAGASTIPMQPARVLESRPGHTTIDGQANALGLRVAGSTTEVLIKGRAGVPGTAAAVVLNVAAVSPAANGYLIVWACGQSRPTSSTLNFAAGQTIANAVIVKIDGGGKICIFTSADTHLVADLGGHET